MAYKPVVLIVLDGVGVPQSGETPFATAKLPTVRTIEQNWPFTTLRASGVAVGLPWGEEGNSEVGHLTMGAGRVLFHHLPRIINAIHDKSFFTNQAFLAAAENVKKNSSALHIMGLFSTGSVHSYIDHLYALLEFAQQQQLSHVYLHLFTDGRDAPPDEAASFLAQFRERLAAYQGIQIASLIGRHYAMDRDDNWDRIEKAYRLLVEGVGTAFVDPVSYIQQSYKKNTTDEFIEPGFQADAFGKPIGRIQPNDSIIFFDYREDSVRELTRAFLDDPFSSFTRTQLHNLTFVTMTEYDERFSARVAFPPLDITLSVSEILSIEHKRQVHIAETEKYAHVTYFFNGGRENPFEGEERVLVPSLRSSHFNEAPEMAADSIADKIIEAIPTHDFILANFANGDMIGHTGDFDATIKALEAIDTCLAKILPHVEQANGALIITGDHGNAEEKRYRTTGEPRTKHTANPVPLYLITNDRKLSAPRSEQEVRKSYGTIGGVLTDIAPTVLELMGIKKPGVMTGISLIQVLK
jgi:2,3-bisphosphoglycerate-independent phosphoglycerate mutase